MTIRFFYLCAAVLVFSGCNADQYFCVTSGAAEDLGCFACDGIGCRQANPPTRESCAGDFDCAIGSVCTTLGCTQVCTVDADCPRGTVCDASGYCLGPKEEEPDRVSISCVRNADCGRSDLICRNAECVIDDRSCGETGCNCLDTGLCSDGFVCALGECRPEDGVCQFDFECGTGRVCLDGACREDCTSRSCPAGQSCDDGVCLDDALMPGECSNDAGCPSGSTCVDSVCVVACTVDAECVEGEYCESGLCVIDERPRSFCPETPCQPGRVCRGGICRTPCNNDEECARVDASIRFCQDVEGEMLCVRSSEVLADCELSVDCGLGERCLDGNCS